MKKFLSYRHFDYSVLWIQYTILLTFKLISFCVTLLLISMAPALLFSLLLQPRNFDSTILHTVNIVPVCFLLSSLYSPK